MKTIRTEDNQTVLDLAMQYYGTADAVGEILSLNPELCNDADELAKAGYGKDILALEIKLAAGQPVLVDDESKLAKKNVVKKMDKLVTTYDHGKDN